MPTLVLFPSNNYTECFIIYVANFRILLLGSKGAYHHITGGLYFHITSACLYGVFTINLIFLTGFDQILPSFG